MFILFRAKQKEKRKKKLKKQNLVEVVHLQNDIEIKTEIDPSV